MIKRIDGFCGYFISDEGKVYCNLGKGNRRNGKIVDLYEIKPRLTKNGYARVYMRRDFDGKRVDKERLGSNHEALASSLKPNSPKQAHREALASCALDKYIHRIVAETYIPNPDSKRYVNHINFIRNDNRISNLEWVTAKENTDITENATHIVRDTFGRYKSNFSYNV